MLDWQADVIRHEREEHGLHGFRRKVFFGDVRTYGKSFSLEELLDSHICCGLSGNSAVDFDGSDDSEEDNVSDNRLDDYGCTPFGKWCKRRMKRSDREQKIDGNCSCRSRLDLERGGNDLHMCARRLFALFNAVVLPDGRAERSIGEMLISERRLADVCSYKECGIAS